MLILSMERRYINRITIVSIVTSTGFYRLIITTPLEFFPLPPSQIETLVKREL